MYVFLFSRGASLLSLRVHVASTSLIIFLPLFSLDFANKIRTRYIVIQLRSSIMFSGYLPYISFILLLFDVFFF